MSDRLTASGRPLPPLFGTMTLPECVDFHSTHNPNETIFVFSEDESSDITKITYLQFSQACDRISHFIRPHRQGPEGEVVAVIALSDTLLYHAAVVGLIRAGLRPFLMSPRNTAEMIVKMMDETSCTRILTTEHTLRNLIANVRRLFVDRHHSGSALLVHEMPLLYEIYPRLTLEPIADADHNDIYPGAADKPPLDDIMIYLHSSGSTGCPKTIPHTYRSFIHWASFALIDILGRLNYQTVMACMPLPCFHTIGVMAQLLAPMYSLLISAIYPPTAKTTTSLPITPNPDNILDHMRRTKVNGVVMVPTLLQTLAQDKTKLDFLATMSFVIYGGAPMPPKVGNYLINAGVKLTPIYGGTEFGCPSFPFANTEEPRDWEYIGFDQSATLRWEPQGDGTYELQFLASERHHLAVENMANEKGYATSDIWVPHPTNQNLWKIVGRKDDVITHTSGEKTVPAPMENIISTSQYVRAAIYFGREKDQPGVLIELEEEHTIDPSNHSQLSQARDFVWPVVQEANSVAPGFSKVFKELILISSPSKPLPRAGKGTVMRKAALALYNDEIESIYAEVNSSSKASFVKPPTGWSRAQTEEWLITQLQDLLPRKKLSVTDDLTEQGLDSLGITILRRRICAGLQTSQQPGIAAHISHNILYQYSSLERLSIFISDLVSNPAYCLRSKDRVDVINQMIDRHSKGLELPVPPSTNHSDKICVLVTGTTGSLGGCLLDTLLHNPEVHTIYTYNRPSGKQSLLQRHVARFVEAGLDTAGLRSPKIKYLEGSLTAPYLGLSQDIYEELSANLTIIIHNAWTVNFNLALSSFEPNILGTRKLIDFARACRHGSSTRFIFVSSISSAYSWDQSKGPYPEEIILDSRYSVGIGYGESKYVSERILERSGMVATSIRIGQISGGRPTGAWATTDWVPILVKSSITLGALPSMPGVTSWIPMHTVSRGVVDVALSFEAATAYNFLHPRPVEWNILMGNISDALEQHTDLQGRIPLIPCDNWLSLLEAQVEGSTAELIQQIPAIKLVDFFRSWSVDSQGTARSSTVTSGKREAAGGPMFDTTKTQHVSKAIAYLPPLSGTDASLWIRYWRDTGFIH